jgi:hypothetical protein
MPQAEAPDPAGQTWSRVRGGLTRLLGALEEAEMVALLPAADDRSIVEVGRVPGQIWLLAPESGVPDERLRALGFSPPDTQKHAWWYAVDLPADPLHVELAAELVVGLLRSTEGVEAPADVEWTAIGLTPASRQQADGLGLRRRGAGSSPV